MKILAIDPGSVTAGYAVLSKEGRHFRYVTSGILRFNSEQVFLERIKFIYEKTLELVQAHQPSEVALESLIYVKSPTALIKLAQARGAMLAALTQTDCRVFEYAPTQVKTAVAGHGQTDKEGIQKIITTMLGITDFKTHDESDAVAIGLCHLLSCGPLGPQNIPPKSKGKGLAASLAHKVKDRSL